MSAPEVPLFLVQGRAPADAPATGERTVVERPPPGLGRGVRTVSSAAVVALTLALVVILAVYYGLRLRKRNK